MSGVSAVPAFKAALVAACHTLYDSVVTASGDYNVATFYGWPTSYSDEMVIVGGASSDLGDPLMGSQRRRLETITIQVQYLCTLGGVDQQTITERAYYLLGLLGAYLTDAGNLASTQVTVGGTVIDCVVSSVELTETEDEDDAAVARTADLLVELTARVHI